MWLFVCECTHLMFTHVHVGTTLKTPTLHTLTSGKSQWSCQWSTPQERDSPSQTPWSPGVSYYLLACRLAAWKEREEGRRRRRIKEGRRRDRWMSLLDTLHHSAWHWATCSIITTYFLLGLPFLLATSSPKAPLLPSFTFCVDLWEGMPQFTPDVPLRWVDKSKMKTLCSRLHCKLCFMFYLQSLMMAKKKTKRFSQDLNLGLLDSSQMCVYGR